MSERIDVTADRLSLRGEGVADVDGLEVVVPGLFAGERGRVRLVHRSKRGVSAVGKLDSLVTPHPARRSAPCAQHESHPRGRCGGCPLMELPVEAQREQKRAMLAAVGLEVDAILGGDPLGYRWSSKRVAFGRPGGLRLGSWVPRTHDGADMTGCLVDHPKLTEAADELARVANELRIEPYHEPTEGGDLRYVWLKTDGTHVMLTLLSARAESRVGELAERLERPTTIAWSVQDQRGNAIRGGTPVILRGPGALRIRSLGAEADVGPLGFLQPNPSVIERAYEDLLSDPAGAPWTGRRAWDLYAGAGLTTARLRERFEEVVPCESYPESAEGLGIEATSVEAFLAVERPTPELVVANPPRKGLGDAACDALGRLPIAHLSLMSCGPAGLARDLARLREHGFERLTLRAWDTLPQTPHVELVAKLARR